MHLNKKLSEGFSLVEVIIALGLLTGVLVSIASMFVLAQFNVKSGPSAPVMTGI